MLEMKLAIAKDDEERNYKMYEIGCYEVYVTTYKSCDLRMISVVNKDRSTDFVPDIYYEDGVFKNGEKKFKIQTTSYGALDVTEIQKFISAYNMAVEVVEILTKEFLS